MIDDNDAIFDNDDDEWQDLDVSEEVGGAGVVGEGLTAAPPPRFCPQHKEILQYQREINPPHCMVHPEGRGINGDGGRGIGNGERLQRQMTDPLDYHCQVRKGKVKFGFRRKKDVKKN